MSFNVIVTNTPTSTPTPTPRKAAPLPLRILGWILGGLSVANLLRDFKWVEIKGLLGEWVQAYEDVILTISDFLFGWISVPWKQVPCPERGAEWGRR